MSVTAVTFPNIQLQHRLDRPVGHAWHKVIDPFVIPLQTEWWRQSVRVWP